jgi:hypothetical protein
VVGHLPGFGVNFALTSSMWPGLQRFMNSTGGAYSGYEAVLPPGGPVKHRLSQGPLPELGRPASASVPCLDYKAPRHDRPRPRDKDEL